MVEMVAFLLMITIIGHGEDFDEVDDNNNDSSLEDGDADVYIDDN
jgi:hypothetical protein